jgi:hypothetical protein
MPGSRDYQRFDEAALLIEPAATATMLHTRLLWVELHKRLQRARQNSLIVHRISSNGAKETLSNNVILTLLEDVFGQDNVIAEWNVVKDSQDALHAGLHYCPRIDFAVKPLNEDGNIDHNNALINEAYVIREPLMNEIKNSGRTCSEWNLNENPRCYLAIEHENKTSTKHRLGSLINAGAIGKMGIVVASDSKVYASYDRILNYLDFLQLHRKQNRIRCNFVVTEEDTFKEILRRNAQVFRSSQIRR